MIALSVDNCRLDDEMGLGAQPNKQKKVSTISIVKRDFEKIVSKGVFPYEHMIGPDVFTETSLPSREAFKNRLKDADVTEEQYKIAQDLWDTFEVK